ncbi:hypothetical protein PIB30_076347, partial [Stylosanthes scabra]|nr:hypothetical protein [Stylosanthes scabra]
KQKNFEDKLDDEEKEALKLFKGKSLTFVQNIVKDCPIGTELERRTFKRAFGLFIQKAFLLPTSSHYISPIHLPVIRDVDNMRRRNWAHHVNSFLIEGIKEYQEKGSQAVQGYHFVLQIIYFKERYEGNNLNDPNTPPPWIQRWCGDNLKEKIRAEDEDITGLIQRAKMRARRKKEGWKRNDKEQTEESDSLGYESGEDTKEEEYQTTDSETDPEPEPETEVQRERRSKKKEDDSVM